MQPHLYLWTDRALYLGPISETLTCQPGTSAFTLFLDGDAEVLLDGHKEPIVSNAFLFPVNQKVTINYPYGRVLNLFLDPYQIEYNTLKALMRDQVGRTFFQLTNSQMWAQLLDGIKTGTLNAEQVSENIDTLIYQNKEVACKSTLPDRRIEKVITMIKECSAKPLRLNEISDAINLSETRLMTLFKNRVGLPLRRYRLWHLLSSACARIASGESLTDAAVNCGFSDSSHFCRNFKHHIGLTPKFLFKKDNNIQVFIEKSVSNETRVLLNKSSHFQPPMAS